MFEFCFYVRPTIYPDSVDNAGSARIRIRTRLVSMSGSRYPGYNLQNLGTYSTRSFVYPVAETPRGNQSIINCFNPGPSS